MLDLLVAELLEYLHFIVLVNYNFVVCEVALGQQGPQLHEFGFSDAQLQVFFGFEVVHEVLQSVPQKYLKVFG